MKEFKLNGISIDFRFLFLKCISQILEDNKKSSKFKEGTNEEQTSYIFKSEENLEEEIKQSLETMKKRYCFDYEIKENELIVKDIKII